MEKTTRTIDLCALNSREQYKVALSQELSAYVASGACGRVFVNNHTRSGARRALSLARLGVRSQDRGRLRCSFRVCHRERNRVVASSARLACSLAGWTVDLVVPKLGQPEMGLLREIAPVAVTQVEKGAVVQNGADAGRARAFRRNERLGSCVGTISTRNLSSYTHKRQVMVDCLCTCLCTCYRLPTPYTHCALWQLSTAALP